MRFIDIISDIETIAALGTTRRAAIRRAVQQRLFEYAASYDWPHYRSRGTLTTIDDYTTGTVAVTNGSKTVTGTSTVFTAAMGGRKFRVGSENAWYDIDTRDSNTQLTLQQDYQGTTASGSTYTIFQDEYKLEATVHKLLDIRQIEDSLVMLGLSYLDMDRWFPDPDTLNDPTHFSLIGRRDDRYTTGTVAVTSGSRTITGTSTVWTSVPGLSRGSRLSIDDTDEVFTVETIASDTSLTVYELPTVTDSSSAYRIFTNNLLVQVWEVPDATKNLYYRFQRLPYPLVNDEDEPDAPREYHYGLVWGGLVTGFALLGKDTAAAEAERRWKQWVALQISQLGQDSPAIQMERQSLDTYISKPWGPRLPANSAVAWWL